MKKAEIIETFNSLTPEINNLNEIYLLYTGRAYTYSVENMGPYAMSYTKDDLESDLADRQRKIAGLRHEIEVLKQIDDMKSSEEGKRFLKSLEDKKEELEKKQEVIVDAVKNSFDQLLHSCGLTDWELCGRVVPMFDHNYIELHNTKVKGSEIHGHISKREGKWVMKVSAPCRGECDINNKGDQYQWYKGYVTICDNAEYVQEWMDKEFQVFACETYDINEEIRKVEKTLKDPYEEYMKFKEN